MLKMLIDTPGLGRGDRRVSGVYLLSFFDLLENPEERKSKIVDACVKMPG